MRIRKDVVLSPVTSGLRNAVADEGWLHDEETNWKLGFGKGVVGSAVFTETFRRFLEKTESEDFALLGVYKKGEPVGFIAISKLPAETKAAEVFLFIEKESRGIPGLALTALAVCLDGLFQQKDIFRVQIELVSINKKAISFLRKFGFTQEGVKKSAFWMGVNSFNIILLRMLRPEWNRLKGN